MQLEQKAAKLGDYILAGHLLREVEVTWSAQPYARMQQVRRMACMPRPESGMDLPVTLSGGTDGGRAGAAGEESLKSAEAARTGRWPIPQPINGP